MACSRLFWFIDDGPVGIGVLRAPSAMYGKSIFKEKGCSRAFMQTRGKVDRFIILVVWR
jgi:hypothetical protein